MTHDTPCHELADDRVIPLGQTDNLNLVGEQLIAVVELLPSNEAGLVLVAAGLELLPGGRCTAHYRETLLEVRAEVDRLISEVADA